MNGSRLPCSCTTGELGRRWYTEACTTDHSSTRGMNGSRLPCSCTTGELGRRWYRQVLCCPTQRRLSMTILWAWHLGPRIWFGSDARNPLELQHDGEEG